MSTILQTGCERCNTVMLSTLPLASDPEDYSLCYWSDISALIVNRIKFVTGAGVSCLTLPTVNI